MAAVPGQLSSKAERNTMAEGLDGEKLLTSQQKVRAKQDAHQIYSSTELLPRLGLPPTVHSATAHDLITFPQLQL